MVLDNVEYSLYGIVIVFMNPKYLLALILPLTLAACQQASIPDCGELPEDKHVGNAGCMIIRDEQLLMVQQQVTGNWSMPGGTAEAGERAACTAQRETLEETGLSVIPIHKITTLQNGFHLYRCEINREIAAQSLDRLEIADWRFFDEQARGEIPWRFEKQHELIDQLVREQLQTGE